MSAIAITGQDTVVWNDHIFKDLADGDCGKVEFDDDLTKVKVGKDGNAVLAQNAQGRAGMMTLRCIIGSSDDKYLNGLLSTYLLGPSAYVLDAGSFFKRVGDGLGNISTVTYSLVGGAPRRQPDGKLNTDGDPEQAVVEYKWWFVNIARQVI